MQELGNVPRSGHRETEQLMYDGKAVISERETREPCRTHRVPSVIISCTSVGLVREVVRLSTTGSELLCYVGCFNFSTAFALLTACLHRFLTNLGVSPLSGGKFSSLSLRIDSDTQQVLLSVLIEFRFA